MWALATLKKLTSALLICSSVTAFNQGFKKPLALNKQIHHTPTQLCAHEHENAVIETTFPSRRELLSVGIFSLISLGAGGDASAFQNKISDKYDDKPKRRGPQPKDLGVATRTDLGSNEYLGLKNCGPAPNCFCSTDDAEDDPEHNIPAWTWPKDFGDNVERAFLQLEEVIKSYEPGQSNIDGGGFQIVKSDPKGGYLYVQFESLKAGYIDDLELAYIDGKGDRSVQVRSSSRVGYLDFGVNAKRLNYIAKALRSKGWIAPGVDYATHQDYAIQNNLV